MALNVMAIDYRQQTSWCQMYGHITRYYAEQKYEPPSQLYGTR